ncbi:MAG: TrbI/VirB10 family protein [Rickettsiales bacterium]|jgi:type IV secretory pathway VirB10-like protein|nr:TrbI/VirB10 family protein [Rickettsiales bacterium]
MKKIKDFFANLFNRKNPTAEDASENFDSKSASISSKKISKYNVILGVLACVLAIIFVIGIIPSSKNKVEEDEITPVNVAPIENVESKIKFSVETIDVKDQALNKFYSDKIIVTALSGKVKVDSIRLDPAYPSVMLENNCTDELVPGLNSCNISISWYPITQEDLDLKIIIGWSDMSSLTPKTNQNFITMTLKTKATQEIVETAPLPVQVQEKPVEIEKPDVPKIPTKTQPTKAVTPVREVSSFDCRRYALSAVGISGNPIGWIQPDKTVYSHRCTKVLGKLNMNGEIIDTSGKIVGYSSSGFEDNKLNKMLSMFIPDNWVDYDSKKRRESQDWATVIANRNAKRAEAKQSGGSVQGVGGVVGLDSNKVPGIDKIYSGYLNSKIPFTIKEAGQVSTTPKDETYVIRRYKPIPAVIAYPIFTSRGYGQMPAIGIVERNVYGENGRTVIIPAGSKVLGQATGTWPNTYVNYSKVQIEWLRIIRPDGAEFVFGKGEAISADAQGKLGVPGKGATDYLEQFVKPMITALVPAAINLLNPVSQAYTSKFILDDSTGNSQVVTSGTEKSSEKAKQELIKTWNTVADQFVRDSMQNNQPPFEVPAGTRITIYPTHDIMLRFDDNLPDLGDARGAGLKDAGAGAQNLSAPIGPENQEQSELQKKLYGPDGSSAAFENIQQAGFEYQISKPQESAPSSNADNPFYIPLYGNAPSSDVPLAEPEFLGTTLDGKYDILRDAMGCYTEDPVAGAIVDEVYVEPEIGCN